MTMKKLDSVIGTQRTAKNSQTGTLAIVSGAAALTQRETTMALARLKGRNPSGTNLSLLSSLKQQGVSLEPEFDNRYEVKKWHVTLADDVNLAEAGRILKLAMVSMPPEEMEKALLASMMLMTKQPGDTPADCAMRCKLYAAQMVDWPADVFDHVLRVIVKHHKWWPSFSDFYKEYEWMVKPRKKMVSALDGLPFHG